MKLILGDDVTSSFIVWYFWLAAVETTNEHLVASILNQLLKCTKDVASSLSSVKVMAMYAFIRPAFISVINNEWTVLSGFCTQDKSGHCTCLDQPLSVISFDDKGERNAKKEVKGF